MDKILCQFLVSLVIVYPLNLVFWGIDNPKGEFVTQKPIQVNLTQSSPIGTSTPIPQNIVALGKCESDNNPSAIHYNDGKIGSHSYGQFQWKVGTADIWVKKLGLIKDWDKLEYADKVNWLLDGEFSTELTTKTIEAGKGNWILWKNCAKQIEMI